MHITCRPDVPNVSHSFHLSVTQEVLGFVSKGYPTPDDIMLTTDSSSLLSGHGGGGACEDNEPTKKLTIETSVGDVRLWVEILRNLAKDLSKHQSIHVSDSTLASLHGIQLRPAREEEEMAAHSEQQQHQRQSPLVAFSCGHAYPLERFQNRIVLEFVERVQEFPLPIPQTLKVLQSHYKQSQCFPSACPHCVFQFLRKIQMEECPKVPIKPWNL